MRELRTRKEHLRKGRRGRLVRVVEGTHRGVPVFWVEYRKQDGKRTAKPFPRSRAGKTEATQYAEGIVEEQSKPTPLEGPVQATVAELGRRFMEASFPAFRPNTQRMARDAWAPFEAFVGPHTIAEDVGRDSMAAFRAELDRRGWAVTTIRTTLGWIRQVYAWGEDGEVISRNRVSRYVYKVAKDKRPQSPAEFRMEEFSAMLAALRLDFSSQWRAHVALGICGYQGARSWSVLHLKWADVLFDQGVLVWRPEWDKMGETREQPMREPTRVLLEVAKHWRAVDGYEGPYVFSPVSRRNTRGFYTTGSLWRALVAAETRAKVAHQEHRAMHGLRRLLAGEVNALTGDAKLAMDAIGDKDIRMAMRYLKRRDDRVRDTFDELDARLPKTERSGEPEPAESATKLRAKGARGGGRSDPLLEGRSGLGVKRAGRARPAGLEPATQSQGESSDQSISPQQQGSTGGEFHRVGPESAPETLPNAQASYKHDATRRPR